jgi:hypothetical protein
MVCGGRSSCVIAFVSAMAATAACTHWGPPPPETPAPPWDDDDDGPEATLHHPDTRVAIRLLEALARDREVCGEAIDVNVRDGVVILLGTVTDAAKRDRALDVAERVQGVRAVHDRMTVRPVATTIEDPAEPQR